MVRERASHQSPSLRGRDRREREKVGSEELIFFLMQMSANNGGGGCLDLLCAPLRVFAERSETNALLNLLLFSTVWASAVSHLPEVQPPHGKGRMRLHFFVALFVSEHLARNRNGRTFDGPCWREAEQQEVAQS